MSRSRTVIHRIVVYGLVGLVVNVLVAWGFAAWTRVPVRPVSSMFKFNDPSIRYEPDLTFSVRHSALDAPPIFRLLGESMGADILIESADGLVDAKGEEHDETLLVARFGWPWRSLRWLEITRHGVTQPVVVEPSAAIRIDGLLGVSRSPLVSWTPDWQRRLPMGPDWPGLIFNAMTYGAAACVGAWTIGHGRCAVRRRRGRCPVCAYDLRGELASGCPECGWAKAQGGGVEKT